VGAAESKAAEMVDVGNLATCVTRTPRVGKEWTNTRIKTPEVPAMEIDCRFHEYIRSIDVNQPKTVWEFARWNTRFRSKTTVGRGLKQIRDAIGTEFGRDDIVTFYRKPSVEIETKFLAAMVWGHEASAVDRPDSRGPWKVQEMFKNRSATTRLLERVSVRNEPSLQEAYRFSDEIPRCGQSFYTKHLYFLGKAQNAARFPLIFDNRVANGIARLSTRESEAFKMISIAASRNWDAYAAYLRFAHAEAEKIRCQPDQVEYCLFKLGGSVGL
jgi:hypothetical protein